MLRNSFINYIAYNRPHSHVSSSTSFLEGVSYIFNQIRKKCTKLEKNISLFVHLSAEKCTNIKTFEKSVQYLNKEINTLKYFIIHKFLFFIDRLLTKQVNDLSFLLFKKVKL